MRKVGFGVIGCGVISTAYLKAAQRFANIELRAVADMRSAAAEKQQPRSACRPCGSISS
jgi:hypothetical protein